MFEAKFAALGRAAAPGDSIPGDPSGGWFGSDLLAELQVLNLKLIRWLRAQVLENRLMASNAPMLSENRLLWLGLSDTAAEQLSTCPCALLDAEFADGATWQSIASTSVRDSARPWQKDANTVLLDDPEGRQLARLTVSLAWHLARHRPIAATLTLGMGPATAQHLHAMRLASIDVLPEWLPELVKPRWNGEPRVWAHLLEAASSAAPLRLESARVGAMQLIARQLADARNRDASRCPPGGAGRKP